jgi:hypothetical protein
MNPARRESSPAAARTAGTAESRDGTTIAYDRQGTGPAIVLVGGGLVDRSENGPLADELAARFTVYNYDRRGRGESGDTQPYALAREIDDIAALIASAGGSAHVYGISSGGALVLEAAAAGVAVEKAAVYEVPYNMAADWPPRWRAYVENLGAALAGAHRGEAVELFMRLVGTSDGDIETLRSSPYWQPLQAIAHTLAYDAACLGDGRPPIARLATITQPTLVATGDARPQGAPEWMRTLDHAADAITESLAQGERDVLEDQGHVPDPKALADVLRRFFRE